MHARGGPRAITVLMHTWGDDRRHLLSTPTGPAACHEEARAKIEVTPDQDAQADHNSLRSGAGFHLKGDLNQATSSNTQRIFDNRERTDLLCVEIR